MTEEKIEARITKLEEEKKRAEITEKSLSFKYNFQEKILILQKIDNIQSNIDELMNILV